MFAHKGGRSLGAKSPFEGVDVDRLGHVRRRAVGRDFCIMSYEELREHKRKLQSSDALESTIARSVRKASSNSEKMPWERGDVLCPAPLFKPAFPRGRLILGRPEASSVGQPTGHEAKVQPSSVLKAVRGGLPKKPGPSWEEKLTLNRRAALAKWEALVWKNRDSFEVARNVLRDSSAGRRADLSQALVDCFAGKASATLHSRVGPLLRYAHFMSREHSDPFPMDEGKLYMFMDRYCRTAAATFARSFLETLNFSKHVLGLDVPTSGISQRVQGVAKACYLDKRKLVQKPPLLVSHVQALEDILLGASRAKFSDYDRVCAGFFCFAVYARARYSDAQASASLQLDVLETESSYGFLEASVTRSKTSYSLERKTRYLPVVAPVLGVRSEPWGVVWHELLVKIGVTLREGWPLLPVPMQGGGYQQAPISPEHAGRLLRELLRRELGDAESISALGTHSLKRTVLSWLAKYGLPREVRAILGYHSSDCGTEIVYARDTLSGPLRQMQEVLEAVTFGRFRPDATRSGYFASEKLARDREPQDELDSSSCGSGDEEVPDYAEDELASDALARWEPKEGLREQLLKCKVYRHRSTRFVHVVASEEEGDRFRCGRKISPVFVLLAEPPEYLFPVCRQCCPDQG